MKRQMRNRNDQERGEEEKKGAIRSVEIRMTEEGLGEGKLSPS